LATFDDHISQANRNLEFLSSINLSHNSYWDWQVTVCYYVNVHIVNAHLANVANLHYRTHEDVKNAVNPFNALAIGKIPEDVYLAYAKLEGLSRRSRYLCHESKREDGTFLTYDKHFAKAIKLLDSILSYFAAEYSVDFGSPVVDCLDISSRTPLKIFKVKN